MLKGCSVDGPLRNVQHEDLSPSAESWKDVGENGGRESFLFTGSYSLHSKQSQKQAKKLQQKEITCPQSHLHWSLLVIVLSHLARSRDVYAMAATHGSRRGLPTSVTSTVQSAPVLKCCSV